jgi:hypothetical protein
VKRQEQATARHNNHQFPQRTTNNEFFFRLDCPPLLKEKMKMADKKRGRGKRLALVASHPNYKKYKI